MRHCKILLCRKIRWGIRRKIDLMMERSPAVCALGIYGVDHRSYWLESDDGSPVPLPPPSLLVNEPEDSPVFFHKED